MKQYRLIVAFIMLFLMGPKYGFSQSSMQSGKKPNIVFILVDDMGWKDLGTYGSTFYETPHIDKLASQGMRFTNAYASSPECSASRSSIMTGQYPVHTGITDWIIGTQNSSGPQPTQKLLPREFVFNLPKSETTIAQALKDHGYTTFFAGKWHLGLSPKYWPLHEGFDYNDGGWAAGNPRDYGMGGYFSPWNNPRLKNGPKGTFLTDRLTTKTIQFIKKEAKKGRPFFVDLSFYAVHEPIEAKKKYIQKFKRKAQRLGLDTLKQVIRDSSATHRGWKPVMTERIIQDNPVYAGLIYSVDQNVGRIMKTLKQLGIAKNTIIVFTSDNGGLATSEGMPTTNRPLRYGKGWLYEGGLRVPLIIKWPRVTKPGSVSQFPVVNTDFYPTFLQMAGLSPMPKQAKDGVSLVPLLKDKKSIKQPVLYWHFPHYSNQKGTPESAIRQGTWKLIQFYNGNHVELYNLRNDIGERYNLAKAFPQKTGTMLYMLNRWKRKTNAKIPKLNPYYNPDYRKVLKKKHETYQQFIKRYQSQFGKDIYKPLLKKKLLKRYHKKYPQLQ
jgi:arylsulfatase A-like enzyme